MTALPIAKQCVLKNVYALDGAPIIGTNGKAERSLYQITRHSKQTLSAAGGVTHACTAIRC